VVRLGVIEELQCGGLDPLGLSSLERKLYPGLSVVSYSIFIGVYQCLYHGVLSFPKITSTRGTELRQVSTPETSALH